MKGKWKGKRGFLAGENEGYAKGEKISENGGIKKLKTVLFETNKTHLKDLKRRYKWIGSLKGEEQREASRMSNFLWK